jgi:hypothetical protein
VHFRKHDQDLFAYVSDMMEIKEERKEKGKKEREARIL